MDVDELIASWDGEDLIIEDDAETGARMIIALHRLRGGRSIGGTRMKHYPSLADALTDAQRLAAGMTLKWAAAGIEAGGGKAVIAAPEGLDAAARAGLLRRFGKHIARCRGRFLTGPDLGTDSRDMNLLAEAAPACVFGRTPEAGGAGDPAPFTASGVFTAMEVVSNRLFGAGGMAGMRVVLQGMGKVARELVPRLREAGAVVAFSDVDPAVAARFSRQGLDFVPAERVYASECEIFAPCAIGGILNPDSIPVLRCAAVVGAANNQLAGPEDADRLGRRGIVYAPDFVANCGGAIALIGIETGDMDRRGAMEAVARAVRDNLAAILDEAEAAGISTEQAARRLAQRRVDGGG